MLRFLDDKTLLASVAELLGNGERADLAVAYWGKGAIEKLGIQSAKPTRILCDLLSGGCNPSEIRKLLEGPFKRSRDFKVHYLDRLHAKVYATPTGVILGSANASANGLGDGDRIGTLEAAIQTNDASVLAQTAQWFEELWKKSKEVKEGDLELARDAWLRKRPQPNPNATLLETIVREPDWFRERVWLVSYATKASPDAMAKFEDVKKEYYAPYLLKKFNEDDPPLYDWDRQGAEKAALGDSFIDLNDGKIYELIELVNYSPKHCIALLKPCRDVQGVPFPRKERALLKKAVRQHLASSEEDFTCNLDELPDIVRQFISQELSSRAEKP